MWWCCILMFPFLDVSTFKLFHFLLFLFRFCSNFHFQFLINSLSYFNNISSCLLILYFIFYRSDQTRFGKLPEWTRLRILSWRRYQDFTWCSCWAFTLAKFPSKSYTYGTLNGQKSGQTNLQTLILYQRILCILLGWLTACFSKPSSLTTHITTNWYNIKWHLFWQVTLVSLFSS